MAFVTSLMGFPVSLLALLSVASGFNLNADLARVFNGANNTNFGYSVALWADEGRNLRIVIGAPKGTNSSYGKGIYPLGNIHMCPPHEAECTTDTRLPELSVGDNSIQAIDYGDTIKSQGIGFGETLYTTDAPNSKLVACVPRYPRRVNNIGYTALQPRGACFVLRDMYDKPVKVMPYKEECFFKNGNCYKNNNVYTGYALHGFSAAMTRDQRDVFMGGPYAFYGQGQLVRAKSGDGKVNDNNKNIYDGPEFDFDTEGWAMVVGKFDGLMTHVATSKIGASSSKGAVKFYTTRLIGTRTPDLIGEESGDRFGFSLAVGDVDGDGADDLLVGAPMAHAPTHVADHGKVYVYYAPTKTVSPRTREVILGKVAWGRFGHAVTSPGDLNQDNYADVVVGAPFDEGGGNIYIFNGGENGLLTEYTQQISASEFSGGLRSFGFSFDGGLDIDSNGFPDLVVGAPVSNAAVLIRTAPVVHLEGSIHFDPRVIPMGKKSCIIAGQPVVCFRIEVNLQHRTKGVNVPINISFFFELDSNQRRLAFSGTNNHSFTVDRMVNSVSDSADPWYLEAYVKEERPRFDIPLVLSTNVSLVPYEEPIEYLPVGGEESNGRRDEVVRLPPRVPRVFDVLNPFTSEAKARLECVDASTCFSKPDLILQAKSQHKELLLSDGKLNLELDLQVLNATAYSTRIEVTYTSDLIFQRVSGSRFLPTCQPSAYAEEKGLRKEICTFSYNLKRNFEMDATFHFEYNALTLINGGLQRLNLTFEVASDIADIDSTNNIVRFDLPVTSRIDLYAEGVSNIDNVDARANETVGLQMLTNPSNITINRTQLGPLTIHTFSLTNRGPSPLLFAEIFVSVPLSINDLPLLYLVDNLVTSSSVSCSYPPLNPLGFNFTSDRRGETTENLAEGSVNATSPKPTYPTTPTLGSRKKRETIIVPIEPPQRPSNVTKKITTLGCNKLPCEEIRCNVTSLLPDDTVYIHITTYVTAATIRLFGKSSVVIESSMTVNTSQVNVSVTHGSDKAVQSTAGTHVTFIEHKEVQASFKDLSVWKMIVAIVVGLMLVIIVSAIMHKLGFFKRKRLTEEQKSFLKKSVKRNNTKE